MAVCICIIPAIYPCLQCTLSLTLSQLAELTQQNIWEKNPSSIFLKVTFNKLIHEQINTKPLQQQQKKTTTAGSAQCASESCKGQTTMIDTEE